MTELSDVNEFSEQKEHTPNGLSRRQLLGVAATTAVGAAGFSILGNTLSASAGCATASQDVLQASFDPSTGVAMLIVGKGTPAPDAGNTITVTGMTPSAFNGKFVVSQTVTRAAAAGSTGGGAQISYPLESSQAMTGAGGVVSWMDPTPSAALAAPIATLGLTKSEAAILTKRSRKLTKNDLFKLSLGHRTPAAMGLTVKDLKSITTAFNDSNKASIAFAVVGGGGCWTACCCHTICCCCCCADARGEMSIDISTSRAVEGIVATLGHGQRTLAPVVVA